MAIIDDFESKDIEEGKQLSSKQSTLAHRMQTLVDFIDSAHPLLEEIYECSGNVEVGVKVFELYSKFCTEIPFTVSNNEVQAYLDFITPKLPEIVDILDKRSKNAVSAVGYIFMPAMLVQKGYNDGNDSVHLNLKTYDIPLEAFCSCLHTVPGRALTITVQANREMDDGLEACNGCTFKIYGGTAADSFGYETTNSAFYHEHERALEKIERNAGAGCSFYLLNPDGTSKRVG